MVNELRWSLLHQYVCQCLPPIRHRCDAVHIFNVFQKCQSVMQSTMGMPMAPLRRPPQPPTATKHQRCPSWSSTTGRMSTPISSTAARSTRATSSSTPTPRSPPPCVLAGAQGSGGAAVCLLAAPLLATTLLLQRRINENETDLRRLASEGSVRAFLMSCDYKKLSAFHSCLIIPALSFFLLHFVTGVSRDR